MSERIYTITEYLLGGCLLYGSYYCYNIMTIDKKHIYEGEVFGVEDGLPKIKGINETIYYIDNQYHVNRIKNGDNITVIGNLKTINENFLLVPSHPRSGIYSKLHPISLIKRFWIKES